MKKLSRCVDVSKLKVNVGGVEVSVGGVVESVGSTKKTLTGGWRSMKPVVDLSKCRGCGLCWVYCPEGCIIKKGDKVFEVDLNYCKGCSICASECPAKAIVMVMEEK